jgi:Nitroreductase family
MYRPLADDSVVRRLLAAAAAAPSIHNTQPWRFRVVGHDLVEVHGDPDRMLWVADPRGRALHLSCGAALLNLRLAIRASGAKPLVWPLPDPASEPTLLASVQLAEGRPPDSAERELSSLWRIGCGPGWTGWFIPRQAAGRRHTSATCASGRTVPQALPVGLCNGISRSEAMRSRLPSMA